MWACAFTDRWRTSLGRGWRSYRCLVGVRWLVENGYGPPGHDPEVAVLLASS